MQVTNTAITVVHFTGPDDAAFLIETERGPAGITLRAIRASDRRQILAIWPHTPDAHDAFRPALAAAYGVPVANIHADIDSGHGYADGWQPAPVPEHGWIDDRMGFPVANPALPHLAAGRIRAADPPTCADSHGHTAGTEGCASVACVGIPARLKLPWASDVPETPVSTVEYGEITACRELITALRDLGFTATTGTVANGDPEAYGHNRSYSVHAFTVNGHDVMAVAYTSRGPTGREWFTNAVYIDGRLIDGDVAGNRPGRVQINAITWAIREHLR
ncbi:hypothetical protein [Catenuloplanes atrovinosus]|uniref:Uncharacterized protein n=1 Tax=Catenuloplanes atrovinosus TaxID=137266 RepID=A0AAE3YS54_9ACTN|nr:hypothetical protein [Catenuloplanes atrovinosus]MDR7277637.1 hypothetical protein [Catenuloplanes atrovinosus]